MYGFPFQLIILWVKFVYFNEQWSRLLLELSKQVALFLGERR